MKALVFERLPELGTWDKRETILEFHDALALDERVVIGCFYRAEGDLRRKVDAIDTGRCKARLRAGRHAA